MRWGRPTKNNKKHRDPRYFMDEKIEEAVSKPGLTEAGEWPEDKTNAAMMSRAASAAERGQRVAAGEEALPPWESPDECGDGFTDVSLDESDYEVLNWILKGLRIGQGRGNMGDRFLNIMDKLGIALKEPQGSQYSEKEQGDIRSSILGSMAKNPPHTPGSGFS